jgi:hypothetical protein
MIKLGKTCLLFKERKKERKKKKERREKKRDEYISLSFSASFQE